MTRLPTQHIVDVHVHVGVPPRIGVLATSTHSPHDWLLQRSRDPILFAEMMAEPRSSVKYANRFPADAGWDYPPGA